MNITERDYMPMALYVIGSLGGLKSLSRSEVKSIAGSVYLKCKEMHDGTVATWPKYLFRSMKNAFLRESLRNTKGGIRQAPIGGVAEIRIEWMTQDMRDLLLPVHDPKVDEKILADEIQAKINSILGTKLASIYLGKVMYDMSYRDIADRVGMSHEWVRQRFNEAETRIERAKMEGVFKR